MNPESSLIHDIDKRKTNRAMKASIEENLLDGPRLYKMSCEAMKSGLRIDHPNANETEIHALLIDRIYGSR
jgi:hypothetical protein